VKVQLIPLLCQDFIGGPVMDSERRFLGITFLYRKTTPFLPVEIAARCLKYYKKSKYIFLQILQEVKVYLLAFIINF